jgi:hypothetical protein
MDGKGITVAELKQAWMADLDRLAEKVAAAMNAARPGRVIADSEELVRDANAEFRQRIYEQALGLLQDKQKAFSPSADGLAEQRQTGHDPSDGQRAD